MKYNMLCTGMYSIYACSTYDYITFERCRIVL